MTENDLQVFHVTPSVSWRGFLLPVLMLLLAALICYGRPMLASLLGI